MMSLQKEAPTPARLDARSILAILGLGLTQIIGWGTIFTPLSILGRTIGADLGLSREWIFGGLTIMLISGAMVAPRIGRIVDRHGGRWVMVTGSVVASLTMVAMHFATDLKSYALVWVLAGIAAPMMLNNTGLPSLVAVVGENARRAITALMLFSGLASTVFLPTSTYLNALVGWRDTYLIFACLHIVVCLPIHAWVLRPRRLVPGATPARSNLPLHGSLPPERRRTAFFLLAIWSCTEGVITWGVNVQVIDILRDSGLSVAAAVGVWTIVGPCQAIARLGELISGGRHSILTTALIATLLGPVAFIVPLLLGVSLPTALTLAVLFGFSHGLFVIARNTLPLFLFGPREFGTYMGLLTLPQNLMNAAAPIVVAAIITHVGPRGGLWFGAASMAAGFFAMLVLSRYCRVYARDLGDRAR